MTLNIAIEGTNSAERQYHLELIRNHKRNLKIEAAHAASLEVRHNTGPNAEVEVVNSQLEANEDAFTTCAADLDSPCECPRCEEYRAESMAFAAADYAPGKADVEFDDCECGGTFDEYDRCSDCTNGHSDCEMNECESCMERAMDRAELWADLARDEEMGL